MVNRIRCHLDISFGIQAEMIYLLYSRIYAIIFGEESQGEESGLWFAAEFLAKRRVARSCPIALAMMSLEVTDRSCLRRTG